MVTLSRRGLMAGSAGLLASAAFQHAFAAAAQTNWSVPESLQRDMYERAMTLARQKVRGGPEDPTYKKPFVDAAFSGSIFLWDTCFIATYAKFDPVRLPIANALDNFYGLQDQDGFICREYTAAGQPFWPKDHPVSINPPLLAFAELELFSVTHDVARLGRVYPHLKAFHDFIRSRYQGEDALYFSDAFGSGMDNIPRYPFGWQDDGQGIVLTNLHPDLFTYDGLSPKWNRQGRSVDLSAQMVLSAHHLTKIARLIGKADDIPTLEADAAKTCAALNDLCWDEEDGFYYDLGYGKRIKRRHIGMFWTLLARVAPPERLSRLIAHLTDPNQFWRTFPIASTPADSPDFRADGGYWLGSVWAPTNYMIILGLEESGRHDLAVRLARQYYWCVAEVYKATGTFWENYAPDSLARGNPSRGDFCGWTALVPITLWHDYIRADTAVTG